MQKNQPFSHLYNFHDIKQSLPSLLTQTHEEANNSQRQSQSSKSKSDPVMQVHAYSPNNILMSDFDITFLTRQNKQLEDDLFELIDKIESKNSLKKKGKETITVGMQTDIPQIVVKMIEHIKRLNEILKKKSKQVVTLSRVLKFKEKQIQNLRRQILRNKTQTHSNTVSQQILSKKKLSLDPQLYSIHFKSTQYKVHAQTQSIDFSPQKQIKNLTFVPQKYSIAIKQCPSLVIQLPQVHSSKVDSFITDLTKTKQQVQYNQQVVIQLMQKTPQNKVSQALVRLLKENRLLKKCLSLQLQNDKQKQQQTNQKVQSTYEQIKQFFPRQAKNQQKQCSIY